MTAVRAVIMRRMMKSAGPGNLADLLKRMLSEAELIEELVRLFRTLVGSDKARGLAETLIREHRPDTWVLDAPPRHKVMALADTAWSRAQTMHNMDEYAKRGTRYVQVVAYLDENTTEICRQMHGRVIAIGEANQGNELVPDAKEQKAAGYYKGMSTSDIPKDLPPYHYNCRTRVVPYEMPDDDVGMIKHQVLNHEPVSRDLAVFARMRSFEADWGKGKLTDHATKHSTNMKIHVDEYARRAQHIIGTCETMMIGVGKSGNLLGYFFDGNIMAVVDISNNRILTCHRVTAEKFVKALYNNTIRFTVVDADKIRKGETMRDDRTGLSARDLIQTYEGLVFILRDDQWDEWHWDVDCMTGYREELQDMYVSGELTRTEIEHIDVVDKRVLDMPDRADLIRDRLDWPLRAWIAWLQDNRAVVS